MNQMTKKEDVFDLLKAHNNFNKDFPTLRSAPVAANVRKVANFSTPPPSTAGSPATGNSKLSSDGSPGNGGIGWNGVKIVAAATTGLLISECDCVCQCHQTVPPLLNF
jgi:hypothetical protein